MEQKTEETYVTEALGFPVTLLDVRMRKFRGEWIPDIDWDRLQEILMLALAHKPVSMTGSEIRFVRQFMGFTLKDFAHACGLVSHQAVMNWEKKEDRPTGMRKSTEILLRARILEALPDELWERIEVSSESPKERFSRRLNELAKFDANHRPVPISIMADENQNEALQYQFA